MTQAKTLSLFVLSSSEIAAEYPPLHAGDDPCNYFIPKDAYERELGSKLADSEKCQGVGDVVAEATFSTRCEFRREVYYFEDLKHLHVFVRPYPDIGLYPSASHGSLG